MFAFHFTTCSAKSREPGQGQGQGQVFPLFSLSGPRVTGVSVPPGSRASRGVAQSSLKWGQRMGLTQLGPLWVNTPDRLWGDCQDTGQGQNPVWRHYAEAPPGAPHKAQQRHVEAAGVWINGRQDQRPRQTAGCRSPSHPVHSASPLEQRTLHSQPPVLTTMAGRGGHLQGQHMAPGQTVVRGLAP